MSFGRSACRVVLTTISRGLGRAIFGMAAGALGGKMFDQDVLDTMIIGAVTGGINGAVDGFMDQLAIETATPLDTGIVLNEGENSLVVTQRSPEIKNIQYILNLTSYGTPALAWFILNQAKENNITVGVAFETYYIGGITLVASAIVFSCCTCCIPAIVMAKLLLPENIAEQVATRVQESRFANARAANLLGGVNRNNIPNYGANNNNNAAVVVRNDNNNAVVRHGVFGANNFGRNNFGANNPFGNDPFAAGNAQVDQMMARHQQIFNNM